MMTSAAREPFCRLARAYALGYLFDAPAALDHEATEIWIVLKLPMMYEWIPDRICVRAAASWETIEGEPVKYGHHRQAAM